MSQATTGSAKRSGPTRKPSKGAPKRAKPHYYPYTWSSAAYREVLKDNGARIADTAVKSMNGLMQNVGELFITQFHDVHRASNRKTMQAADLHKANEGFIKNFLEIKIDDYKNLKAFKERASKEALKATNSKVPKDDNFRYAANLRPFMSIFMSAVAKKVLKGAYEKTKRDGRVTVSNDDLYTIINDEPYLMEHLGKPMPMFAQSTHVPKVPPSEDAPMLATEARSLKSKTKNKKGKKKK